EAFGLVPEPEVAAFGPEAELPARLVLERQVDVAGQAVPCGDGVLAQERGRLGEEVLAQVVGGALIVGVARERAAGDRPFALLPGESAAAARPAAGGDVGEDVPGDAQLDVLLEDDVDDPSGARRVESGGGVRDDLDP